MNRTATTNNGDKAVYTANLLNQYEERDIPGRVRLMGSALPEAIITVNNEQSTRQQDGYFHWSQTVANTNSAAFPGVSILAVLQGAGTNGADIVATETGRVFVAESPELFTYDLDGNLLTDGRWTNTWDGENRLIRVETRSDLPGEIPRVRADFTYDGQGRRIAEERFAHDGTNWVSTASTRFLYDGWLLLAEVDDSDAFTRTYTWGLDLSGSMQGAGGVGGLLAIQQGGNTHAYAYDGNGNVIALVATDGTAAANYEYGPFGEPLRATGPAADANHFRFSTKWVDQDTGWLYYGYRWMDPGTGRFLGRDPIEEAGGLNLYAFVANQPKDAYDLLGLKGCCGADHTESFKRALSEASAKFDGRSWVDKFVGCFKMFEFWPVALSAWDLEFNHFSGASGGCKETVTIGGSCYNMWDVNYALWGLGAQKCKRAYEHAMAQAWVYKAFKSAYNLVARKSGPRGTADARWEFNQTMTGWSKYGFEYPAGSFPPPQTAYKDCTATKEVGTVRLKTWQW